MRKLLIGLFLIGTCASENMAQSTPIQSKPLPSWLPDPSCMQEYEKTIQHGEKCKEQLISANKRAQEEMTECNDAMQKVNSLCGKIQDSSVDCYKKHQSELKAACNGF